MREHCKKKFSFKVIYMTICTNSLYCNCFVPLKAICVYIVNQKVWTPMVDGLLTRECENLNILQLHLDIKLDSYWLGGDKLKVS